MVHLNPFHATDLFLYPPRKHQKTKGFLMFLGGRERGQWHEMDQGTVSKKQIFNLLTTNVPII